MINTNNNNNGGYGGYQQIPVEKTTVRYEESEVSKLMSQPLKYDRITMVKLAKYMGWSGLHFFHFGRPFPGICHLLFSLIGILGVLMLSYLVFFGPEEGFIAYLMYMSAAIIPLLLSILGGILYSVYWSIHSDEDFEAAFPNPNEKK